MTAVAWFFLSAIACSIGAFLAIFTVTTHKGLNGWVALGFTGGALFNTMLILAAVLKPQ